ncbi:MAG: hypothetical protein U0232_15310 [Thermomicrobiales bacterium]
MPVSSNTSRRTVASRFAKLLGAAREDVDHLVVDASDLEEDRAVADDDGPAVLRILGMIHPLKSMQAILSIL